MKIVFANLFQNPELEAKIACTIGKLGPKDQPIRANEHLLSYSKKDNEGAGLGGGREGRSNK